MKQRTLAVISAGIRQPSSTRLLADQLAAAIGRKAEDHGISLDIEWIELRPLAHDIMNNLFTGFPAPDLAEVIERVRKSDALVAVTPIFAASYSGLFKSFFDILEEGSLVDKPVLIGATGGTGRHSLALEHAIRPLFSYLRAVVMPTSVFAAPEDWGSTSATGTLASRVERAAGELVFDIGRREPSNIVLPTADPIPFARLLDAASSQR